MSTSEKTILKQALYQYDMTLNPNINYMSIALNNRMELLETLSSLHKKGYVNLQEMEEEETYLNLMQNNSFELTTKALNTNRRTFR
ncbi:MAG: hypothetical protein Q4P25_03855 [Tissierellia bacterium]|nr:hypothetical protein [Tissierellia bacterium]